jgi:hypothetical protein
MNADRSDHDHPAAPDLEAPSAGTPSTDSDRAHPDPVVDAGTAARIVPVVDPAPQVPVGIVQLGAVDPELAAVADPPVVTTPNATRDREVADALARLHEALITAGRSLDRVAAALPRPETVPGTGTAPRT